MPKLTLSQYLKYAGIIIGILGALRIIYAEFQVILEHFICLIVMGVGAAVYFAGVWEAKHEAAVAAASTPKVTSTTTTTAPIVATTATTA